MTQVEKLVKLLFNPPGLELRRWLLLVLLGLVAQAARALPEDFDIEVFEAHHKRKVDAPSGTALMLGEAAARGRGVSLGDARLGPHDGITGPRQAGGIGFSVVRGGGIIGEHSVIFAGEEEVLTLSHSASDRGLFARGAIAAAVWPTVDRRALDRAFSQLSEQEFTFSSCEVSVQGVLASAACTGHARFVPKVGNTTPRSEPRRWDFRLRKAISGWVIDGVNAR